jgi:hypothetical protein
LNENEILGVSRMTQECATPVESAIVLWYRVDADINTSTLRNVVAQPLGSIQQNQQQSANYEQQVVFPLAAITQARNMAVQFEGQFVQMRQLFELPISSATLASLFDVSLRPSEPTDQEISKALFSTPEIPRLVHRSQEVILRDLPIEGGDQARETFRTNHGINFEFLQSLSSPDRNLHYRSCDAASILEVL